VAETSHREELQLLRRRKLYLKKVSILDSPTVRERLVVDTMEATRERLAVDIMEEIKTIT
jgi:hypothetical protein